MGDIFSLSARREAAEEDGCIFACALEFTQNGVKVEVGEWFLSLSTSRGEVRARLSGWTRAQARVCRR